MPPTPDTKASDRDGRLSPSQASRSHDSASAIGGQSRRDKDETARRFMTHSDTFLQLNIALRKVYSITFGRDGAATRTWPPQPAAKAKKPQQLMPGPSLRKHT